MVTLLSAPPTPFSARTARAPRRLVRALVLVALPLGACGGDAVTPAATPAATAVPPMASAGPAQPQAPASSEPSVLTEAQRRRDDELAPKASAIVDAFPNHNGAFSSLVASYSRDGKRILFGSTRDGAPEIYLGELDRPGEKPAAVTTGPERATWATFTPDGRSVLFLRDSKGDENHAIWRVGLDGAGLTNLTPGETLHRGDVRLPRGKPGVMLYSARKVADPSTALIMQSLEGGAPKTFYTLARPAILSDVTADASRALTVESFSGDDSIAWEVDVTAGKARRVYPPEGKKAGIVDVAYVDGGKRILVSTDEGSESSAILALDAKGVERGRYVNDAPKAAPMSVLPSPAGGRGPEVVAVRVNAGNHGEVRLLDAKTLKPRRAVKVPLGDVQMGSFRGDGRAFSILISLPNQPADPFEVDVTTGELRPLRADKRAGLEGLPPVEASIETVKAFDGLSIPINVYLPAGAAGRRLPTIINFHGGPAYSYPVRWHPYTRFFVSLGYAVLEPNVRGSTGFGRAYEMADNREKRADWLKDVETVNAWAKAQPWCDRDRVAVWGQSYGGYTTLMALTRQPNLWRAGVDLYGVADLKAFLKTTDAGIRSYFVAEFGDLEKDAALLDEFSPMRGVDKITAPLFVYAGQNDPRVPRSESDAIVRSLRARGGTVEYMVAANEGHSADGRGTKIELLARTARFLEEHLR